MILGSFVALALIALLVNAIIFWSNEYKRSKKTEELEKAGHYTTCNINIAYLYVHIKTGELKVVSKPRKDPIVPNNDPNWEVIDIWWENPDEQ